MQLQQFVQKTAGLSWRQEQNGAVQWRTYDYIVPVFAHFNSYEGSIFIYKYNQFLDFDYIIWLSHYVDVGHVANVS
jgi:hypothetical protein